MISQWIYYSVYIWIWQPLGLSVNPIQIFRVYRDTTWMCVLLKLDVAAAILTKYSNWIWQPFFLILSARNPREIWTPFRGMHSLLGAFVKAFTIWRHRASGKEFDICKLTLQPISIIYSQAITVIFFRQPPNDDLIETRWHVNQFLRNFGWIKTNW